MTNELMDKVMTDMELDNVAGGVGYAYFVKRKDGKYNVVSANDRLTPEQVKGIMAGKSLMSLGIERGVHTHFFGGVRADKLGEIKVNLDRVYKGCRFQHL